MCQYPLCARFGTWDYGRRRATRSDTNYVDAGPAGSYYKLSAVDVNGNESSYALVTPSGTTSVDGMSIPSAVFLAAPSPNPARDGATLRFGLPREASVSLRIYDVNGRLVRELAGGTFVAGVHTLTWELNDASGGRVSSGMFFVRLLADGVSQDRRFAVVR